MKNNELGLHNIEKTFRQKIEETNAKIYDGSLRSGNKLEHEGTIIVIGDVNAGSEVVSGENVIVLGTIRGLAHAGASGNKEAIIVANEIDAPQVRIADIVKELGNKEEDVKQSTVVTKNEKITEKSTVNETRQTEKIIKKRAYIKGSQIILE